MMMQELHVVCFVAQFGGIVEKIKYASGTLENPADGDSQCLYFSMYTFKVR